MYSLNVLNKYVYLAFIVCVSISFEDVSSALSYWVPILMSNHNSLTSPPLPPL